MKQWFFIILIIITSINTLAQSVSSLENRKKQNEKDLAYTQNLLKNTQKNKEASLEKLKLINRQISTRKKIIGNINEEITFLDEAIEGNTSDVKQFEEQLDVLRNAYAKTISYSYFHKNHSQKLMFLLSASDFNQAYRRLRYMKQYNDHAKKQITEIKSIQTSLYNIISDIKEARFNKRNLLDKQEKETKSLTEDKKQQSVFQKTLKKKEKKLKRDIERQKKLARRLDKKIRDLIASETKKTTGISGKYKLTPQEKKLSGDFGNNKGKLPWPTRTGFVSSRFGEQPHPVLKKIKIRNDGIDITTDKNADCVAVFNGKVSEISTIPGLNNIIILRHGDYLTVYINLTDIIVKKGDKIKKGQKLGTVFTDKEEEKTVLKFQLWKSTSKLNPGYWLSH